MNFCALGPPKNLPEAYVYHYFCAGRPKVPFLGEMGDSGAQNLKMGRLSWFWAKMGLPLGISPCHLKKVKYFPRKTWCFDMWKSMDFMNLPWCSWKLTFFMKSGKIFFTFCRKFKIFHPCAPLLQMLLKPMEYYTFWVVLGAMGSLFEKKCVFIEFLGKCGKM